MHGENAPWGEPLPPHRGVSGNPDRRCETKSRADIPIIAEVCLVERRLLIYMCVKRMPLSAYFLEGTKMDRGDSPQDHLAEEKSRVVTNWFYGFTSPGVFMHTRRYSHHTVPAVAVDAAPSTHYNTQYLQILVFRSVDMNRGPRLRDRLHNTTIFATVDILHT